MLIWILQEGSSDSTGHDQQVQPPQLFLYKEKAREEAVKCLPGSVIKREDADIVVWGRDSDYGDYEWVSITAKTVVDDQ